MMLFKVIKSKTKVTEERLKQEIRRRAKKQPPADAEGCFVEHRRIELLTF